jgi:nucleoside-diphosphate kinase
MIKPDAVAKNAIGSIIQQVEEDGFRVVHMVLQHLTQEQAAAFYEVHKERPFYGELIEFMTSGPSVQLALERENAVARLREVVGATDSTKAESGTIRNRFGTDIQCNAVHASDSVENGRREVAFYFGE